MENKGVVLMVEDNVALNISNSRALLLRGYEVMTAHTLREARERLAEREPDIILLDVMLPDGDGFSFCREIRRETTAHILFLTAKTAHEDIMHGLAEGGDDYIAKPFHPEELLARIASSMRRREIDKSVAPILTIGPLKLDLTASQAFIHNKNLELTPKEFALLFILSQHKGDSISKEALYELIWKQPMLDDSSTLRQHISRLKKKLEKASEGSFDIFVSRTDGYSLEYLRAK